MGWVDAVARWTGGASAATVRHAVRALARSPGFTAAVVFTLAVGIGATTAMFTVLHVALQQDLPFRAPHELVLGRATFNGTVNPQASYPDYLDYRTQVGALSSLAAIGGGANTVTVSGTGEPVAASITPVSANLFQTLGILPQRGAGFSIEEQPLGGGEVVISHGFWERWFGSAPDVIGRSLLVDGTPMVVVGVMPAGFRFLYDTDLWVPPWPGNHDPATRRFHNWLLVGRLQPGASLASARREADVVSARLEAAYPESNRDKALQLDGLHAALAERYRPSLLLLSGAVVLVLLIACGNVASLLLARRADRSAELSLRAALGAGRGRLVRELLVESVLLALAAGVLGVALATVLQRLVLRFVPLDLLGVSAGGLSLTMLAIALGVSAATVVLFGVYPSVAASRADPAAGLREASRRVTSRSGLRVRSALVVTQVAVSLVLLVGSGLLLTSLLRLRSVDPGFRMKGVLTATIALPSSRYADADARERYFQTLAQEIAALPGVENVGLTSHLPILQWGGNYETWNPAQPPQAGARGPWADRRVVLPGYFETMAIPLLQGRLFDRTDVAGSPPVIVLSSATAAALFPDQSAVGRVVAVDMGGSEPKQFEVVGVVGDLRGSSLAGAARATTYLPFAQFPQARMRLAVAAADPEALVRSVRDRMRTLDPDILLTDVQTLEEGVTASIAGTRSITTILGVFAGVAVALASLGLYGVLAFFVARRRHEIGVRIALGASHGRVLRLVVLRGLALVGIGAAIGLAGALWSARVISSLLFETRATEPAIYISVTALLAVVGLGACLLPTLRALGVQPAEALRTE